MPTDLNDLLVDASKDGRADEIACGLMAMGVTASVLFLTGVLDGEKLSEESARAACEVGLLAKAKAMQFGEIAAAKLLAKDTPEETVNALAGAIGCAVIAQVSLHLQARASEGNPVAAAGMVSMAAQSILKDIAT